MNQKSSDTLSPTRPRPQQRRSAQTVARILATAGELLDEIGVDRLTTNLICERAGLTPPALYRHFANKYAVMQELAHGLMTAQDESLYRFMERQSEPLVSRDALAAMLTDLYELTCSYPGGRSIMRSLHSMPELIHVRLGSHRAAAKYLSDRFLVMASRNESDDVRRVYRVAVEIGYSVIEMAVDETELHPREVFMDAATAIEALLEGASKH